MARNPKIDNDAEKNPDPTPTSDANVETANEVSTTETTAEESPKTETAEVDTNLSISEQIAANSRKARESAKPATAKATKAAESEKSGEGGARHAMVNDPDNEFKPVKRSEFIARLWAKKMSRRDITDVLNDARVNTTGKKIPYQIVFAATKGKEGGPPPKPVVATTDAEKPTSATEEKKVEEKLPETAEAAQ